MVAVRVAAEAGYDVVVLTGEVEVGGEEVDGGGGGGVDAGGEGLVEGEGAVLVGEGFAVFEGEVGEDAFDGEQGLRGAGVYASFGMGEGDGVVGEGEGGVAVDVAGELVGGDDEGEQAAGGGGPGSKGAGGGGFDGGGEAGGDVGVGGEGFAPPQGGLGVGDGGGGASGVGGAEPVGEDFFGGGGHGGDDGGGDEERVRIPKRRRARYSCFLTLLRVTFFMYLIRLSCPARVAGVSVGVREGGG